MTKYSVPIIFLLVLALIILLIQIGKLRNTIEQKQMELDTALEYIKQLSAVMGDDEQNENKRLRSVLEKTLQNSESAERNKLDYDLNSLKKSNWKKRDHSAFIPDLVPIDGQYTISNTFSEQHQGIDLPAPMNEHVMAAAAGKVIAQYFDEYFGNIIIIDHLNQYATVYGHLEKTIVVKNQFVEKGMLIAGVGNTGNSSAPHLHFEILVNAKSIDPLNILENINKSQNEINPISLLAVK